MWPIKENKEKHFYLELFHPLCTFISLPSFSSIILPFTSVCPILICCPPSFLTLPHIGSSFTPIISFLFNSALYFPPSFLTFILSAFFNQQIPLDFNTHNHNIATRHVSAHMHHPQGVLQPLYIHNQTLPIRFVTTVS